MSLENKVDEIIKPLKIKLSDLGSEVDLSTKVKALISTFKNLGFTNFFFGVINLCFSLFISDGQVTIISLFMAGFSGYMLYKSKTYFTVVKKLKYLNL